MDVLIVAATSFEIQPLLSFLKKQKACVAITGVGCPVSVYMITKAIRQYKPQLVIQAGIAGCFDRDIGLGAVAAVTEDRFGDIGVMEQKQWRSVFDMGFAARDSKPFKDGRLKNPNKTILKKSGLKQLAAVTVNEITTNKMRINLLREEGIALESMEGAALHYAALMEKVPFLQIRAVSNYVGERNKNKWNIKDAISNLNAELKRIVGGL
ncbi:MAG: futalosine hydrolase [Niabella sp.]